MRKIKGYKGMDANMRCRGMQYAVGKTYHVDGEIELCKNGLHFCKNLVDVFNFYPKHRNRFFEVETRGQVCEDGVKCATDTLAVLRELTNAEINRVFYSDGYGDGDYHDHGCYDGGYYGTGCGYGDGGYCGGYFDDGCGYGDGEGYGDDCYNVGEGYGDGSYYGYDCYCDYCDIGGGGKNIQSVLVFK